MTFFCCLKIGMLMFDLHVVESICESGVVGSHGNFLNVAIYLTNTSLETSKGVPKPKWQISISSQVLLLGKIKDYEAFSFH